MPESTRRFSALLRRLALTYRDGVRPDRARDGRLVLHDLPLPRPRGGRPAAKGPAASSPTRSRSFARRPWPAPRPSSWCCSSRRCWSSGPRSAGCSASARGASAWPRCAPARSTPPGRRRPSRRERDAVPQQLRVGGHRHGARRLQRPPVRGEPVALRDARLPRAGAHGPRQAAHHPPRRRHGQPRTAGEARARRRSGPTGSSSATCTRTGTSSGPC